MNQAEDVGAGVARIVAVSAPDPKTLLKRAQALGDALSPQVRMPLDRVAVSTGARPAERYRMAVVARTTAEAARILVECNPEHIYFGEAEERHVPLVYLLPGVGEHYPGMLGGLYRTFAVVREAVDRCTRAIAAAGGRDPRPALLEPLTGSAASSQEEPLVRLLGRRDRSAELEDPEIAQVGLFVAEYALASFLGAAGCAPDALLGYSLGEYVAAALAGVLPVEQIISLLCVRARLVRATRPGGMLAVLLDADRVHKSLDEFGEPDLAIGAVDGPAVCIVSGSVRAVDRFEVWCGAQSVATSRLPVHHGFHSPLLAEAAAPLTQAASRFRPRPPVVPMLSNVSGGWLGVGEAIRADYWARHMTGTVRFADNVAASHQSLRSPLYLEVGPGRTLGALVRSHPAASGDRPVLATIAEARGDEVRGLVSAVARAWTLGVSADLGAMAA